MFAVGFFGRNCSKALRSSIHSNICKCMMTVGGLRCGVLLPSAAIGGSECDYFSSINGCYYFGLMRAMSSAEGRSIRSKVERRMRRESGKTLREIRRAKKLRKKLMTDEERLIYNLRRAKKKVAVLLQKLKKYELPEFPPSPHDPELLTMEQLQAYKKIGFRNKNYVPVGVRGVFGGVVQNMHMHWKFHETVQVCCDNFPKEKIREMATMLARLSGGIVVNIHNVKTIIMFRGRNYRQPKNLIPFNTLTKRKALFKARFEQALESQKLNIKKIEQQLRRMGVNPEDPVAMASIRRVAATFFNAIDSSSDSPYVFHQQDEQAPELKPLPADDSDQEELDRFIAEIEDAADKEWEEEEAAEREEIGRLRYWNRENTRGRFPRYHEVGNDEDEENSETDADDSSEIGNSFIRRNEERRSKMTSSNESMRKNYGRPRGIMNGYNSPETDADDSPQMRNRFSGSKVGQRLKASSVNIGEQFMRSDSSEEDDTETGSDDSSEMRGSFCRRNNEQRPKMTSASESRGGRPIRFRKLVNDDYSEEEDDETGTDDSSEMRDSLRRKHDDRGSKLSSVTENDDDSGFEDLLADLDNEMWRSESEKSEEDKSIHRPSSSGRSAGRTDSAAEYVSSDED